MADLNPNRFPYVPESAENVDVERLLRDNPDRPIFIGMDIDYISLPRETWERAVIIGCKISRAHVHEDSNGPTGR